MLKQSALISGAVFTVVYLAFSYSIWDLNPANWDIEQRAISVMLSILLFFIISLIAHDSK